MGILKTLTPLYNLAGTLVEPPPGSAPLPLYSVRKSQ
jgi:hypothetical protein